VVKIGVERVFVEKRNFLMFVVHDGGNRVANLTKQGCHIFRANGQFCGSFRSWGVLGLRSRGTGRILYGK
jgi:hypothetical protein